MENLFQEAWNKNDQNGTDVDTARHWFFTGVAAQKQVKPELRTGDGMEFARMRNAQGTRQYAAYRDLSHVPPEHFHARFLEELIAHFNRERNTRIVLSDTHSAEGVRLLRQMSADGLKLNNKFIGDVANGRDRRYKAYNGYSNFFTLLEYLFNGTHG